MGVFLQDLIRNEVRLLGELVAVMTTTAPICHCENGKAVADTCQSRKTYPITFGAKGHEFLTIPQKSLHVVWVFVRYLLVPISF